MSSMPVAAPVSPPPSSGGRLVATDGRALPFKGSDLSADAAAGLARVVLRQTFVNPHDAPLRVTYQVPLPADAAVSGFAFEFAGRRVVGVVDRKAAARERFEQALVEGRTAALLEQDRSSLFTQEVGNVPPGAEIRVEIALDQPLVWLPEGRWEWRFPTTVAPRYLGAEGRVPDAERVAVDVSETPMAPRLRLALAVRDAAAAFESPSHPLAVRAETDATHLALEGARLDRDVVVRWTVAGEGPSVALDLARPGSAHPRSGSAYGRLVLVPPAPARRAVVPRDLVVLIDTSGSMSGEPLAQARAVASALVATLGERDTLELIEFSTRPRRWRPAAVAVTEDARAEALAWLASLRASGGTEMREGILAALAPLRAESQRQVILVTDGLIGFEDEIVAAIRQRLPAGSRVHALGIGSSVNRSLTRPAARAGGGVEVIVAPGEDPAEAAARLVARTEAPLVVDVTVGGTALRGAPARLPDLFGGAPAAIPVEVSPDGGTLLVTGRTPEGTWERRVEVTPTAPGSGSAAVVTGFARERVEDLEIAGGSDAAIEQIGLDFQVATRLTAWVAVAEGVSVDPRDPTVRERIPHEVPHATSVEGLGLRHPAPPPAPATAFYALDAMRAAFVAEREEAAPARTRAAPKKAVASAAHAFDALGARGSGGGMAPPTPRPAPPAPGAAPSEARPPVERTLRGRVVLARDGRVVIEIDVDADAAWNPAAEALVERPDGTVARVAVDRAASTAPTTARAGTVLRLVLRDAGPVAVVRIVTGGVPWVIRP